MNCKVKEEGKEPGFLIYCDTEATRGPYCEKHYNEISRFLFSKLDMAKSELAYVEDEIRHFLKEAGGDKEGMTTEKQMTPIVDNWVRARGFVPLHERCVAGYVDIIGVQFYPRQGRSIPPIKDAIAIELKIRDIKGVLKQCINNRNAGFWSYAAFPLDTVVTFRRDTLVRFAIDGIGLLSVRNEVVEVLPPTDRGPEICDSVYRALWRGYRNAMRPLQKADR